MKGFTLVEILLVIAIFAILISFLVPMGLNFYKGQQLEFQSQGILQTLRRAQLKAMAMDRDSSFGVYLTNNNYILFKGNSYAQRDPQYDETFSLAGIINISGLNEIVFLKFQGIPKESPAHCGGVCTSCPEFTDKTVCLAQDGCSWSVRLKRCSGSCISCDSYQIPADCQGQSGCSWYPGARGGNIILGTDSENRIININEMGRVNLQ